MTSILLLLLQFNVFAQRDSTKSKSTPIYSLTDNKTKGTPTVRLRPTRFLVYKSLANSSNAKAQQEFSDATAALLSVSPLTNGLRLSVETLTTTEN